ncbi:LysR family transcriptional regulator [Aureimonas sp. OT7]|uniref:LysR family transcriptional regulator n=1 Tax=Aureimonas sp. OT7 TaxID=2816454 RepID=UPI001FEFEF56|nr:LysR family transcriptional regulator [Aureimonas sp. OT7]
MSREQQLRGVEYAELVAFLAVARDRSFRQAADALAVSPSAISHTLRALEDRLGTKLVNRTTRSVSLTDAGRQLERRLAPAFADIEGAVQEAAAGADKPAGTLRLTVPRVAAQMVLSPILGQFLADYPNIRLEITVDDALVDSVADGFDAGIRLDERVRRDMEAVPVSGALRGVVVGSPAYLAVAGVPTTPEALSHHRWLNYRLPFSGRLLPWEFSRAGKEVALSLDGPLTTNDVDLLIAAALDGAGLACITEATITDHLDAGRLVRLLDDWCPPFPGWTLYYPRNRHIPPPLRAFIDFLTAQATAATA